MLKRFEVVGNVTPTLCRELGGAFTLGAARRLAEKFAKEESAKPVDEREFYSFDVDNGRGTVLYTAHLKDFLEAAE